MKGRKKKSAASLKIQCVAYIEGQVVTDLGGKKEVQKKMYHAITSEWEGSKK